MWPRWLLGLLIVLVQESGVELPDSFMMLVKPQAYFSAVLQVARREWIIQLLVPVWHEIELVSLEY